jgi:hypothetical protein
MTDTDPLAAAERGERDLQQRARLGVAADFDARTASAAD